ncbi:DUF262 domain-containing protein [Nonomuraea sp. NPDC050783]|uniref:DUF262 domain-containing protein n=1 Tax=Nonomuraea sp. NPDC050783 TaxID=3154634 RepID=UPI003466DAD8
MKKQMSSDQFETESDELNVEEETDLEDGVEDEIEDEEGPEIYQNGASIFEDISTYTLDWSVSSVMERLERGFIDVSPPYQRRPVWNQAKNWRFLESLMLAIPVPQLVLATKKGAKGKFIVLDGKQRLLALKFALELEKEISRRRFSGMEILKSLNGKTLRKIREDDDLSGYWDSLLVQPIRTVVVQNYADESVLHTIFHRLNQNSVSLSPQELRRALMHGDFMEWLDRISAESQQVQRARRLKKPDFRMRDAEMVLRFFALARRFDSYNGNLRVFLDEEARYATRRWSTVHGEYENLAAELDVAIEAAFDIFGDNVFFRYDGKRFIGRFNAPLFEVLTLTLRYEDIRNACLDAPAGRLEEVLKQLSISEPFKEHITSTTKSIIATQGRMQIWIESALEREVGLTGIRSRFGL